MLSISAPFLKNFLILTCCIFGRFQIQTLRPNGFTSQANDTLKLLGHNYNHLQEVLKQENVAVHHCGFKLKLSLKTLLLRSLFWVNFINVAVVKQILNSIRLNEYVYKGALLSTVCSTKKIRALHVGVFWQKFPNCGLLYFRWIPNPKLTTNRFKNQTNEKLKLLGHNCDHQQEFFKQ